MATHQTMTSTIFSGNVRSAIARIFQNISSGAAAEMAPYLVAGVALRGALGGRAQGNEAENAESNDSQHIGGGLNGRAEGGRRCDGGRRAGPRGPNAMLARCGRGRRVRRRFPVLCGRRREMRPGYEVAAGTFSLASSPDQRRVRNAGGRSPKNGATAWDG